MHCVIVIIIYTKSSVVETQYERNTIIRIELSKMHSILVDRKKNENTQSHHFIQNLSVILLPKFI